MLQKKTNKKIPGTNKPNANRSIGKNWNERWIEVAIFKEPDLGDQLTAVVFIVDERVFNEKKYPKPEDFDTDSNVRKAFLKSIGGRQNLNLREFLKQFRLA